MGSMILLNEMGDVEFSWDSSQDDKMKDLIERKMKEGVRFFILKPMLGGFLHRKSKVKDISQVSHTVHVGDADIEKLLSEGSIQMTRRMNSIHVQGLVTDPAVAASQNVVGVRQLSGG